MREYVSIRRKKEAIWRILQTEDNSLKILIVKGLEGFSEFIKLE
jgi:hypothetical protein